MMMIHVVIICAHCVMTRLWQFVYILFNALEVKPVYALSDNCHLLNVSFNTFISIGMNIEHRTLNNEQ